MRIDSHCFSGYLVPPYYDSLLAKVIVHGDTREIALARSRRALAELEIDGLRPYREGSPASRIHWPTVARRGEMLERRLVAELDSAPLIVLDAAAPASEEALDKAVRAAASLCVWLARHGGCAILLPGERRPIEVEHDMGSWPAVHLRLALVERGGPPASSALGPRGGAVLWVTAADLRGAPRALERLPAGARYIVTPEPRREEARKTREADMAAQVGAAAARPESVTVLRGSTRVTISGPLTTDSLRVLASR